MLTPPTLNGSWFAISMLPDYSRSRCCFLRAISRSLGWERPACWVWTTNAANYSALSGLTLMVRNFSGILGPLFLPFDEPSGLRGRAGTIPGSVIRGALMPDRLAKLAILSALRHEPDFSALPLHSSFTVNERRGLLHWLDQSGLALTFVDRLRRCGATALIPDELRVELEQRLAKNVRPPPRHARGVSAPHR